MKLIEMDNRGEVSHILYGITFDRKNNFQCGNKLLIVLKITYKKLFSALKILFLSKVMPL